MYKQIIIARKDLNMSPGKLSAQVSHGSMAFLTREMQRHAIKKCNQDMIPAYTFKYIDNSIKKVPMLYRRDDLTEWAKNAFEHGENYFYVEPVDPKEPNGRLKLCEPTWRYDYKISFDCDLHEEWINGIFTKTVLAAKNRNHLLKAKTMAEELGMVEDEDFFLIKDCCKTELEPEEVDENGIGRTLTVIGFKPMSSEIIDKICKKYQLYK